MLRKILVVLLVVCAIGSADAAVSGRVRQCKATCGPAIDRCVEQGGRRRKCRQTILRSCKRQGVTACVLPGSGTYTVATDGTDDGACGTNDAPCRTIQFVVDNLIPLDGAGTIKVAAGTYDDVAACQAGSTPNEAVVCIRNRDVTLLGGFSRSDWDTPNGDPSTTVLDGRGSGRAVRMLRTSLDRGTARLVMDGFTLQNGLAQGASSGSIDQTWAFGGGLLAEHSAVTLRNLIVRNNRSMGGDTHDPEGGRGSGGGVAFAAVSATMDVAPASLEHVRFEGNEAVGGSGVQKGGFALGGGLFTFFVATTADDVTFTGNTALAGPSNGSGTSGGEFSDALGGAVAIEQGSVATLRHVNATGNASTGGDAPSGTAGGGFGGALFTELADVTLSDALVSGNTAQGGAGANPSGGSIAEGGGIHTIQANCTIERSVVVGNLSQGGAGDAAGGAAVGGGVALVMNSSASSHVDKAFTLRNVVVADNRVNVGAGRFIGGGAGGIWIQGAVGTIDHATLADNRLLNDQMLGAGMTLVAQTGWETGVTVNNTIVANHTGASFNPASWANAAVWVGQGTQADLTRTLFANNAHDTNAGVSGGLNLPPGTVNLASSVSAADAGFVAPGAPGDDFHLVAGSPAVDQATASSVTDDMDGQARPYGAKPDIGADEFVPAS